MINWLQDNRCKKSGVLGWLVLKVGQALTPQAKGQVERLFQTLQDRLVKAMRLAGICDIDAGNAWLPGYVAEHNARFASAPANPEDAHRPYAGTAAGLARIGALHHIRTLSKDLVLSFQWQRYIVQAPITLGAATCSGYLFSDIPTGCYSTIFNSSPLSGKQSGRRLKNCWGQSSFALRAA